MAKSFLFLLLTATAVALTYFGVYQSPNHSTDSNQSAGSISALILPHHDFVKRQRQEFLAEVKPKIKAPETIILLSPNHYDVGQGMIQTSLQTWHLSDRDIQPNTAVIDQLGSQVSVEPGSFANEHGIKLVLGDIWQTFPQAKIVPIIFKTNVKKANLETLEKTLVAQCDNCLLIASVDFSHYQPALLANLHDQLTERALMNLDIDKLLTDAEIDSPAALAVTALWARDHSAQKFVLANHTNSGVISKSLDAETTTHFFAFYTTGDQAKPPPSVSFIIGGDMMFGRMIAHTFLAKGLEKSLEKLGDRVFWGTDASMINLEGPISKTPVPDDIRVDNLTFNFPPQTIKALQSINVKAASLANNHSANAGSKGLADTRELLTAAGIQPFGGSGADGIDKVVSFVGQDLTLDVIGVHLLASQPNLAPLIKKLKTDPTHRVLVFPHWGAEYAAKHAPSQEALAHAWIDAGADLVIGTHPHVIQDAEVYKNRPIFYSLGNLLFDQTFSTETQQGLLIAGEATNKDIRLFALPIEIKSYQPQLMRGSGKAAILDTLYAPIKQYLQTTDAGTTIVIPLTN